MKIFVKTFGCALNQHDSEVIKGILASNGHELTEDLEDAEVVVVNTCAVKQPTENKVINFLKKLASRKVIVSGCLPLVNLERLRRETEVKVILGPSPGEKILLALEKLRKGETFIEVEPSMPSLEAPKIRKNPIIEIIPISYGCLGSCSYCCVRFARGKLRSYKPEEIVGRVRKAILEGVKEIWLTSQDTGAYGLDIDSDLPSLLSRILEVNGDFYVRIGMMNPENLKRIFDEFLEVFEDRRIFKFLHLPIQSGDNRILKLMNRRYKIEEVEEMISEFRKKFKELTLETDVICGFPGEGEEEFKHTLDFLRRVKP
ncbi:MAG TPA: tRNA (N(6)-L-threonylcarbamoyladenosine(37)-C(2))-methylthiotransferase, partial [Candidatus Aenigmarchaeota archaeon]|nr:tRNA (N(6)-L-threonylcarbamoyladenosine(37)-C(2))-methylthiotransferase [Candidatus Aenigmarchaeota archaeon]